MSNFTEILIKNAITGETLIEGGKHLMASVSYHDELVIGFASNSEPYEISAKDDYSEGSPYEYKVSFEINPETFLVNRKEITLPMACEFHHINQHIYEGLSCRKDWEDQVGTDKGQMLQVFQKEGEDTLVFFETRQYFIEEKGSNSGTALAANDCFVLYKTQANSHFLLTK